MLGTIYHTVYYVARADISFVHEKWEILHEYSKYLSVRSYNDIAT